MCLEASLCPDAALEFLFPGCSPESHPDRVHSRCELGRNLRGAYQHVDMPPEVPSDPWDLGWQHKYSCAASRKCWTLDMPDHE